MALAGYSVARLTEAEDLRAWTQMSKSLPPSRGRRQQIATNTIRERAKVGYHVSFYHTAFTVFVSLFP